MLGEHSTYREWAQTLSDEEWCEFLAPKPVGGHVPPPLRPQGFQMAWVGNAEKATFREAIAFCQLLKSILTVNGFNLCSESRLLDIGVGWGGICRTLLRETPHIIGIDPVPTCIDLCRSALPTGQFELSPSEPPYRFEDCEFDLVYLYSVFSHVNETLFLSMLREATRLVREGGFVVFTTLAPRDEALPGAFPRTRPAHTSIRRTKQSSSKPVPY